MLIICSYKVINYLFHCYNNSIYTNSCSNDISRTRGGGVRLTDSKG